MTRQKYRMLALSTLMMTAFAMPVLAESAPVSESEPQRMMAPRDGHGPGDKFQQADANGDGFITKDEMAKVQKERMDKMFSETDTNNDGKLTPEEMRAGREKWHEKMKEKRGDRREKMKEMKEKRDGRKQTLEGGGATE
jgi:Ca2+-binding EF-hand superfamily protein